MRDLSGNRSRAGTAAYPGRGLGPPPGQQPCRSPTSAAPRPRFGPGRGFRPQLTPLRQNLASARAPPGLLPRAGPPLPRRRGRAEPADSSPAAPAPGPLTCTCLRKWSGPPAWPTARSSSSSSSGARRRPRHLARRAAPGPALGSPSSCPSVCPSVGPASFAASAAPAPGALRHASLSHTLSPAPGPHPPLRPRKHHPSRPSACPRRRLSAAATAAALRSRGPGGRAPTAMMGCVM